jgi:xanthine/uracil/vitamin C permease (AzgA family)
MSQSVPPSRRIGDYRDELRASLAAQSELGSQMSDVVAGQFLREIEVAVDEKIEARISRHERAHQSSKWLSTVLVVGSTTAMVPLTAAGISAGGFEGFIGVFISWCLVMVVDLLVLLRK